MSPSGKAVCRVCHARRARRWRAKRKAVRLAERRQRLARRRAVPRGERQWAAGLFEGEGTLSIITTGRRPYTRPLVSVTSTDMHVVDFFQARWPGFVRTRTPRSASGRARPAHEWSLVSNDPVEAFLLDMRALWRTARVRAKADLLLEEIRDRVCNQRGEAVRARSAARLKAMRALNRRGREDRKGFGSSGPTARGRIR